MKEYLTGTLKTCSLFLGETQRSHQGNTTSFPYCCLCDHQGCKHAQCWQLYFQMEDDQLSASLCSHKGSILSAAFLCTVTWNKSIREQEPEEINLSLLTQFRPRGCAGRAWRLSLRERALEVHGALVISTVGSGEKELYFRAKEQSFWPTYTITCEAVTVGKSGKHNRLFEERGGVWILNQQEGKGSEQQGWRLPASTGAENGPLIPTRTFWSPPLWTGHFMCPQLFSLPDCSGPRPLSIFCAGFLLQALITMHGWPPPPADSLVVQLLSPLQLCREVLLQDHVLHLPGTFSGFPPTSGCAISSFPLAFTSQPFMMGPLFTI